jgi:hypothetical protein
LYVELKIAVIVGMSNFIKVVGSGRHEIYLKIDHSGKKWELNPVAGGIDLALDIFINHNNSALT